MPFRAVYGGDRLYKLVDGRMVGVTVDSLGGRVDDDGNEQLLVHSPELRDGDLIVTTHMPNAMDGLRVETASDAALAKTAADASAAAGQVAQ